MDPVTFSAFVDETSQIQSTDEDTPPDYLPVHAAVSRLYGVEKLSWDWHKFREGAMDEGVPLSGATIGAALGARSGFGGLRGAALGYAAGSGASLLRSKMRGEKPSLSRKVLALSGLGYGLGGMGHVGLEKAIGKRAPRWFPPHGAAETGRSALLEEGIPAAGAVIGSGAALATDKSKVKQW